MGGASGKSRDKHMADLIERGFTVLQQNKTRKSGSAVAKLFSRETKPQTVKISEPATNRIRTFSLRAASGGPENMVRIVHGGENLQMPSNMTPDNWGVQIGVFPTKKRANEATELLQSDSELDLETAIADVIPIPKNNAVLYRARLHGITHDRANTTCKTLASRSHFCLVIAPS